jgi:hypothetical protein
MEFSLFTEVRFQRRDFGLSQMALRKTDKLCEFHRINLVILWTDGDFVEGSIVIFVRIRSRMPLDRDRSQ